MTALRFDHAILLVTDLTAATADFQSLGFNVFYGGQHTGGKTHNALIVFQDSTYLELLAPTDPALLHNPDPNSFLPLFAHGEGSAGYALVCADLAAHVAAMRGRGLEAEAPVSGGRLRPDGNEIGWQSARVGGSMSPFFIEDVTERTLRVPNDADKVMHPNGVTGMAGLTFVVDSLNAPVKRYEALLGMTANTDETRARFVLDGVVLRLTLPTDSAMRDHHQTRGDAPYRLTLRTAKGAFAGSLNLAKAHKAHITLVE